MLAGAYKTNLTNDIIASFGGQGWSAAEANERVRPSRGSEENAKGSGEMRRSDRAGKM